MYLLIHQERHQALKDKLEVEERINREFYEYLQGMVGRHYDCVILSDDVMSVTFDFLMERLKLSKRFLERSSSEEKARWLYQFFEEV